MNPFARKNRRLWLQQLAVRVFGMSQMVVAAAAPHTPAS